MAGGDYGEDIPKLLRTLQTAVWFAPDSAEAPLRFVAQWAHLAWMVLYAIAVLYNLRLREMEDAAAQDDVVVPVRVDRTTKKKAKKA